MTADPEAGLRRRLLDCALAMVEEEGVQALTLRAIARRAEVSHGAPLRHFPSRAALLSAVAAEGYGELERRREQAARGCGPRAADRLRAAALMYVGFAVERRGLFELMSRPDLLVPSDPLLRRASRPVFEMLVGLVADCQAEGWRTGADTRLLAAAVWSAVHGFTQLWLMGALTRAAGADALEPALQVALDTLGLGRVTDTEGD
ncbi:TetR/AcrR family transcriptional regulator [Peterkaempfera griseoplana]|uniref:TetR/AcrR family transcriptional regulator n=1 Tax=Peterkaempfera griseoplana TaxID=66896 RepID=UPI0006E3D143|nr:TetR/AcrR family transcriptional regulator [Peterkaempfera griseoplana]